MSVHHRLRLLAFPMRTALARTRRRPDARYPRFRRDPFARDVALDPGGTTMPRITALLMLRSTMKTVSAPASIIISWLTPTPHATAVYASCSASPPPHATLASRRPATALPGPDLHRLIAPALPGAFLHSITSSARASSIGGIGVQVDRAATSDTDCLLSSSMQAATRLSWAASRKCRCRYAAALCSAISLAFGPYLSSSIRASRCSCSTCGPLRPVRHHRFMVLFPVLAVRVQACAAVSFDHLIGNSEQSGRECYA